MHDLTLYQAARSVFPNVLLFDGGRYVIAALLFAAVAAVIMRSPWRVRKLQQRRATRTDYQREIVASVRSVLVYALLFTPVLWLTSNGVGAQRLIGASGWTVAAYVIVLLIGHDTYFYWTHRLLHDRRLFATFHRTHHRSITPTPFAAYAFGWQEAVIQAGFFIAWQLLIPTPTLALFITLGISILRNAWGHLGIELHPAGFVDHRASGWLTTTTHHDLHHSGGFGTNYGLYFTWWDRICGTEHPRYREIFREVTARPLAKRTIAPPFSAPARVGSPGLDAGALPATAAASPPPPTTSNRSARLA